MLVIMPLLGRLKSKGGKKGYLIALLNLILKYMEKEAY
jgi:hypothetical protein